MNSDQIKGTLQQVGGHVEEAAGALVGDQSLKSAGQEDQIKGEAREAWGNVKDAGDALIDRAKAAKLNAEEKSARAEAWDREHRIEIDLKTDQEKAQEKARENDKKAKENQDAKQNENPPH